MDKADESSELVKDFFPKKNERIKWTSAACGERHWHDIVLINNSHSLIVTEN